MLSSIHPSIHPSIITIIAWWWLVGWLVGWLVVLFLASLCTRSVVCMHACMMCLLLCHHSAPICMYIHTHTLATVLLLLLLYIIIIIISLLLCCVSNNNNNSGGSSNNERWASYELRFVQYHLYLFHTYIHTRWEGVPIELSLYVHSNHPSLTAASAGNIVHVSIDNSSSQKC